MRKSIFLFAVCIYNSISYAQYVGIGTTTPGSGLEVRGTGLGAQQRITDATSGNSLVLQGGPGANMKITGYNYGTGTAQSLYLSVDGANTYINPSGGNIGIGTESPTTKLTVYSNILGLGGYGIEHTDGTRRLGTYLNSSGGWIGTISNHPLHFFTNDGIQQMTLTQSGQLGIGTTAPLAGYRLDIAGGARSFGDAAHFVSHATGGTNSWARFYMRSGIGVSSQSWFIGTSLNYNGNQFYLADETYTHTRFSIQPNNGPIYMQGNITQNAGSYGLPKAMVYLNGDGTIIRCYNGLTGANNCSGFGSIYVTSGWYYVDFPFDISLCFFSVTVETVNQPVTAAYQRTGPGFNRLSINTRLPDNSGTDRPVMIIVY
ncbi:MAG TPA: hypothetical protein VFX58_13070 [Chitinophagaceae bacterium]|nr:hypothetical protein [Chitinophagaceae bacterium]